VVTKSPPAFSMMWCYDVKVCQEREGKGESAGYRESEIYICIYIYTFIYMCVYISRYIHTRFLLFLLSSLFLSSLTLVTLSGFFPFFLSSCLALL